MQDTPQLSPQLIPAPAAPPAERGEAKNSRERQRYRSRIPRVSAKEGELFRNDSGREKRLRITKYVVCRICFAKLEKLIGGQSHLRRMHGMTDAEYLARYPGAPLICSAQKKELSQRSLRVWEGERTGLRPKRRVRGHDEGPASRWLMVCLAVEGHSQEQIAKNESIHRTAVAVFHALDAVGLSNNKPAIYYFGEPWTGSNFRQLKAALCLTAHELADEISAPRSHLVEAMRPGRALWKGRTRRIDTALARLGIAWRDATLGQIFLAKHGGSRSPDVIDKRRVLKTFFPNLRNRYKLLVAALREIRQYLKANPSADAQALQDNLYFQAKAELGKRSTGGLFAQFLPWAPSLMPFLEANVSRLRVPGDLAPIANEAIAARWNAPPNIVAETIKSRTRPYTPREMRQLIRALVPPATSVPQQAQPAMAPTKDKSGKSGGRRRRREEERERFKVMENVRKHLARFEQAMRHLKALKRLHPEDAGAWRNGLLSRRYSDQEIDAVLGSKTPKAAAQRYVARLWEWKLHSVQSACSALWDATRKQGSN